MGTPGHDARAGSVTLIWKNALGSASSIHVRSYCAEPRASILTLGGMTPSHFNPCEVRFNGKRGIILYLNSSASVTGIQFAYYERPREQFRQSGLQHRMAMSPPKENASSLWELPTPLDVTRRCGPRSRLWSGARLRSKSGRSSEGPKQLV